METMTQRVEFDCSDEHAPRALTSLARTMFDTYAKHAGGVTFDGRPIPTWEGVSAAVRGHWRAAAAEAAYQVTAACKRSVGTAVAGELQHPVLPESV